MAPFYLILSTFADGETGASDPQANLSDAADEYGEAAKWEPATIKVMLISGVPGSVADVTRSVELILLERASRRSAA